MDGGVQRGAPGEESLARDPPDVDGDCHRRDILRGGAAAIGAGTVAALGTAGGVGAASAQNQPDYGGWFENVSNFDGTTVDHRDRDEISIAVGASGNGGNLAFDPPAVMVTPGTTVTWQWTGEGGVHNVVAEDGSFDSGTPVAEANTTFQHTFESEGVHRYACGPHKGLGMKGAVVVRPASAGGSTGGEGPPANPDYGGWFDNVSNFDGSTADRTGREDVSVAVGSAGNGGNLAFDPPAVRVSTGTTVTWRWTGEGGVHNVVAQDGSFDSGTPVSEAGTTFQHTFDEPGIYPYYCNPHKTLGMKGAIVVGEPGGGTGDQATTPGIGIPGAAVLLAFGVPLLVAARHARKTGSLGGGPSAAREGLPPETTEAPVTEPEQPIEHDEFDPWGTAALVAIYFGILVLMWVFTYFVEFLGRVSPIA